MRFPVLALLTAVAIAAHPGVGRAETGPEARSLDLQITGKIKDRCQMGQIGDIDLGDLTVRAAQRDVTMQLDCNLPFAITVQARNGAISHITMPGGQGPYAGRLPYQIGLMFAVRKPSAETISQTFESRNLLVAQSVSSRGGIASDGMRLTLALGQPGGEAGLLAGSYSETIEITVAPE